MREVEGAPEPVSLPRPEVHQLTSSAGKLERISQHSRGLVEDITTWVELKIQLLQAEVTDTVEHKLNRALAGAIVAVMALVTAIFFLTTIALALGAWLGHPAWGFLIVSVLLALLTVALAAARPRLIKMRQDNTTKVDTDRS